MSLVLVAAITLHVVAHPSADESTRAFVQADFATASVMPATLHTGGVGVMRLQPGGGFIATNATLRELVAYAYQRHPFDRREVIGGPAWIDTDRFDLAAKAGAEHAIDADGTFRQTWAMLGRWLADKFKVTLREEYRDRLVYGIAHYQLGVAMLLKGDASGALAEFEQEISFKVTPPA